MAARRHSGPALLLAALTFLAVLAPSSAEEKLIGEYGQGVRGCRCKGRHAQDNGHCGYHINMPLNQDKPWCRTMYSCGYGAFAGSWTYCDERGVERRPANDGKLYTSKEFKDHYGTEGKDEWVAAVAYVEQRMARNQKAYTVHEFRDYYIDSLGEQGWVTEWLNAKAEQRKANDGKWYT